ncbi:nucleotidyltransferase [Jeotgalibacillus soli]|uniref:tRNA(Met) cytidine acetate ligase n=1 Tax=Jeotgalibacillus soli TaxID=889306 RepID=A0A0C2VJX0_9BACL|nr:nucleotidyltransferase [Jeotgalibacillus soli]KIL44776.1 hypothetical protein KP78_23200 [Jeotgalibacillus soli]
MKATGMVVEYNPFHNGHLFHALAAKEQTENDVLIAVMSGPFLQRGEPALVSKWARTKMALLSGVDIVVELPYVFSTQHATTFASGSIAILGAMGCSAVCFGSEDGQIAPFLHAVQWKKKHSKEIDRLIQQYIRLGLSYPSAVAKSYTSIDKAPVLDLSKPNNILGLHYTEAIDQQQLSITPHTIKRVEANYHDEILGNNKISSATSIRKKINGSYLEDIEDHVPPSTYNELLLYKKSYHQFHSWEDYWSILQYKLVTSSLHELRDHYEIEEGIEHRLQEAAYTSLSFLLFMEQVKTKRYTWTRIQRMLTHLLTGTKKSEVQSIQSPTYIRLLGMTDNGRNYLQKNKKKLTLPLVSKVGGMIDPLLNLDLRAGRTYALGIKDRTRRQEFLKKDFTQPPIHLHSSS